MPDFIRLGSSPRERGSLSGTSCPDVFTDGDRVYLIGRLEDGLPAGAPADAVVGDGEVVSSMPVSVFDAAARDRYADIALADSEAQGQAQRDRVMLAAVRAYADELYSAPWKVDACGVRERLLGILTPPGPSITFEEALAASSLGTPGVQAVTP